MSKSILVIDTPECCVDCEFVDCDANGWFCGRTNKEICKNEANDKRPDWCPLQDLPEKKEEKQYLTGKDSRGNIGAYGEARNMVAVGWNMCIDEILKGANGNE